MKTKETVSKKVLEAAYKAWKKPYKDTEEFSKLDELLSGSEGGLKNNDINKIINVTYSCMPQYICYYFQKRIINLTKIEKVYLKTIMSQLLVEYYEKYKQSPK